MKFSLTDKFVPSMALLLASLPAGQIMATEPCEDFGECKALIEINASDGDIGFHFLMDADDLVAARVYDANGMKVFEEQAKGPLFRQRLTETFVESSEPLCWEDPEGEPGELVVNLEQFLDRWAEGEYLYIGRADSGEFLFGATELTYELPAAPVDIEFNGAVISWDAGEDLGECATEAELEDYVDDGLLPTHPRDVEVDAWEVVLEPDLEDGDPLKSLKFSIRVPGDVDLPAEVSVPEEYLAALPEGTPVKIEVGAIGGEDNATFSEEDGFCVSETGECEEEEEEE